MATENFGLWEVQTFQDVQGHPNVLDYGIAAFIAQQCGE